MKKMRSLVQVFEDQGMETISMEISQLKYGNLSFDVCNIIMETISMKISHLKYGNLSFDVWNISMETISMES